MPEQPSHKKRVISGDRDAFDEIEASILELMQIHHYEERAIFSVRVAIEEALANALLHGHAGDPTKEIEVTWYVDEKSVEFSVTDQGRGYDPNSIPDPTANENLNIPSGRGLAMINAFMDEVIVNDLGNQVFMKRVKNRSE